jgi:integral membrane protein (TIGR01906 family)
VSQTFQRFLTGLIAVAIPFFLIMTAVRVLFVPVFLQIEYRMPGFPEDMYGFTLEDRLHWGTVSIDYMYNNAGIDFLGDQRLPDGAPLYNERELSHMLDVKILFQKMITAWWILLGGLALLGVWARRGGWARAYWRGLGWGGKLTIGLIVFILAAVAISFRQLFTLFHRIFFVGDTWLFLYSDSLIRLFPIRLWQDAFIMMGLFTILAAVLLIVLEKRIYRNK